MKIFSVFIFLLSIHLSIFSQPDTLKVELSEVVVSATKTENPTKIVGSSITVISANEIEQSQKSSVVELLRDVEGISIVQQGGPGKLSNVFTRGSNSDHTLILIDGVEANDPGSANNAYDFSFLAADNIERIEILRGPQSTLYGSDAMAGVINIITKNGGGSPKFNLSTEGGTNNYYRGNLGSRGSLGLVDYSLNFSRLKSNGLSAANSFNGNIEKDGYLINSVFSKIGINLSNNINFKLIYNYKLAETKLDQAEKNGDDPNFSSEFEEQLFRGETNLALLDGKLDQKFGVSLTRATRNISDEFDEFNPKTSLNQSTNGTRLKFDWQSNLYFLDRHIITLGAETEEERAESQLKSTSVFGPYNSKFELNMIRTTGLYLQDQIHLLNSLFFTIGGRYDNHQKFGSQFTYRFAGVYIFRTTNTKLKATYGTGFKAPGLFDLFDPLFGNLSLEPETSTGWDVGFEQFFLNERINVGATYYYQKINNLIGFDPLLFKSINVDAAKSTGVEASFTLKNLYNFSLHSSYTFSNSKDIGIKSADRGKQLIRRPKHKFSVSLNYNYKNKINLNTRMRIIGEREDTDFNTFERVRLKGYSVFDLAANLTISSTISVFWRIENLFNEQYEEVLFYGTQGTAGYIGINVNL